MASSTLVVTGATFKYGNVNINGFATTTAASGNFDTQGRLMASSTLVVTGASNFYSDVNVNGYATTTGSNGNFSTNGTIGVASTTPTQTLGVKGSGYFEAASGTTTIYANTDSATIGSCIQLRGIGGTLFKIFAAATTSNTGRLVVEAGTC